MTQGEGQEPGTRAQQMPWRMRPFLCKIGYHGHLLPLRERDGLRGDLCSACGGFYVYFGEKKRRRYEEWADRDDS